MKVHEKLPIVPEKPGVYVMRDGSGSIIYIGKAKNLKNRVRSYFVGAHDEKTTKMLQKVHDIDWFVTKTELDALGLEANLIKRHKPHYNILLKDSKSFPYIRISTGDFPYLEVTRKLKQSGRYFGPYYNGIWARELLDVLGDIFPVKTCIRTPKLPCLNHQIGRCLGVCTGNITKDEYSELIERVAAFLRGEREFGARAILEEKMHRAADQQQFELAIRYRRGLEFLDKLKERTITQVPRDLNCDVFAGVTRGDIWVVSVLTVRAGALIGIQNFSDKNMGVQSEDDALQSFVMQYYDIHKKPFEIITHAKAGVKRKLLDMARENAENYLDTSIEKIEFKHQFTKGACEELSEILNMRGELRKIECFDISHFGGEMQVASMVVFVDGVAEKKLYRKFNIKHDAGNNDYLSMFEVIKRRLARIGTTDAGFGPAPDLIIVDGGKGQLSAALDALSLTQLDIPIISIAKQHEEIFVPNSTTPIILPKRSYALRLVQRIRDEAHRFAVTFHKSKR